LTAPIRSRFLLAAAVCLASQAALAAPAFNYLAAPVDVTPTVAGAWVNVDVSAYVPYGATGVLVLFQNPTSTDRAYGIRKNGSSDDWQTQVQAVAGNQGWLMTGLDPNRIFEVYTESTAVKTYLLGYTLDGVTFLTNRVQKTIGFINSWRNVDISGETAPDTALGGIFTIVNRGISSDQFGLRKNGSLDDRVRELDGRSATLGVIGVDAAQTAELQVETVDIDLYLVGYVTHGAAFFTNAVNKSTSFTNVYRDVDISADIASRANGALVEIFNFDSGRYPAALRANGSASDLYLNHMHGFAAVGTDSSDVFEQKVGNLAMDLYLVGYSLDPRVNYRSIGTAPDYTAGSVSATTGSPTITGAGVGWLSANRGKGDRIQIEGVDYVVLSVNSETELTLTSPFVGTPGSGKLYILSRQYSTLPAWENCVDGGPCAFFPVTSSNLVTDDRVEVGVAYDDSVFTSELLIEGSITDAAHGIVLTAAEGNRHAGQALTGVRLVNGSANPAIGIQDDFVTVEWIEIQGGAGTADGFDIQLVSSSNRISIRNNLIHHLPNDGIRIRSNLTRLEAINNVVYATGRSGIRFDFAPAQGRFFNNTIVACLGGGFQGAAGGGSVLDNNLAHGNSPSDFNAGGIAASSSNNLSGDASGAAHSPAGGGLSNVSLASLHFFSTLPGGEDFHIASGSAAQGRGENLIWKFREDIDSGLRSAPWDIGADEAGAPGGAPTMASSANQSFLTGSLPQAASAIAIADDPLDATITAVNDIRIHIPEGFHMRWRDSVSGVGLVGSAAGKVSSTVAAYEDLGRVVVLDVESDFVPGDTLTITGLGFQSFTAPSPLDYLQLEVGDDGLVSAFDSRTVEIRAAANVTLSSDTDQMFTVGAPPRPAAKISVTDGTPVAFIGPGGNIRLIIPPGLAMDWDSSVGSVSISGSAAGKVSAIPVFETPDTVRFDVSAGFLPGEFVTISGLRLWNFTAVSPPGSLQLDVGTSGDTDDKTIAIDVVSDVPFLTATATDSEVLLEWVNPAFGDCALVHVRARDDGLTPSISDRPIADVPCTFGAKQSAPDSGLVNDNLYQYGVFIEDSSGGLTAGKFVRARPFLNVGTVQWAYSTGAASLAVPGLRINPPATFVYAVSNDSILHSMVGGPSGGAWPGPWIPYQLGGPAQARPPVVAFAVGAPAVNPAAFVGSQDGRVYAIDAVTGALTWVAPMGAMVQAAPSGHFDYYYPGARDIVLAGTRDSSGPNSVEAVQVHTGAPVWSYDNSPAYGGNGKDIGIISGSLAIDYPNARAYFATRKGSGANGSPHTLWRIRFGSGVPAYEWSLDVGDIDGAPVLYGGIVYVGNNAGRLYAVDAGSGVVKWSRSLGDGAIKSHVFPQFGAGNLFLSTATKVWSIADNGFGSTVNWSVPEAIIKGPSTPTYVPGTGKILVGSADGKLYQIDIGSPLTPTSVTLGIGDSVVGPPAVDIVTTTVYVGTDEGVIYAVNYPLP